MKQSDHPGKNPDIGKGTQQTRKDRAIMALLQNATIDKAAAAVNMHPSTLYRWMKEPDFRNTLNETRNAAFSQSMASLQQVSHLAANRLVALAIGKDTPPGTAVRACDAILNHGVRSFQWDLFETRLSKLEEDADKRSKEKNGQSHAMLEEVGTRSRNDEAGNAANAERPV